LTADTSCLVYLHKPDKGLSQDYISNLGLSCCLKQCFYKTLQTNQNKNSLMFSVFVSDELPEKFGQTESILRQGMEHGTVQVSFQKSFIFGFNFQLKSVSFNWKV